MSKPEDLVATRETSERLREAGFPQTTYFWWDKSAYGGYHLLSYGIKTDDWCSAPTLGEVLEQFAERGYSASVGNVQRMYLSSATAMKPGMVPVFECSGEPHTNPAEAAALLWLRVCGKEATP